MRRHKREGPRKRNTISILGTGTADTLEIMVAPEPSIFVVSRLHSDMNIGKIGYINTAFDREQSWHTQYLKQFMSQENLICGVDFIK